MTKMYEKSIYSIMLLLKNIPHLFKYNSTTFRILCSSDTASPTEALLLLMKITWHRCTRAYRLKVN